MILVYNLKMRLVLPQYHMVHDVNFDTVRIDESKADAQADLDAIFDKLFVSSRWQHSNTYSNCDIPETSHHYFDHSWDLAFKQAQAASQHKHEVQQQNGTSGKCAHDFPSTSKSATSEGAPSKMCK
jgi:hypothetical protein